MTKRSPAMVFVLALVTFGIYGIIWLAKTKGEMVKLGAEIPTTWFIILGPLAIWYMWKFAGGVEHVTQGKSSQAVSFILLFLLGSIGMAIIQSSLNSANPPGQLPSARVA
jgi:uncharacterized protein DUF4234